ncbi:MAG: hypothetical protein KGL43_24780 [Burkholderiales bacterium]|nr:hypothetical protein [Burkholderiales bacterium]MDE2456817.1 hypothetical protein [Burkholderiales bacterium]
MSLFFTSLASLLALRVEDRGRAILNAPSPARDSALAARQRESAMAELPPPVRRYLRLALPQGGVPIQQARLHQVGRLRTSLGAERWLRFDADHCIEPENGDFDWNARAVGASGLPIRVRDSLVNGQGSSRVSLLSTLRLRGGNPAAETSAAVLARYLADSVWYPSALLPSESLVWSPIDERRALATLSRGGTTVAMEFGFDAAGEIESAYAPIRWGRFAGGYEQKPWHCFYSQPVTVQGLRIPRRAESGWYDGGEWHRVSKQVVVRADYDFARDWTQAAALHDRLALSLRLDADPTPAPGAPVVRHGESAGRGPHHALALRRSGAALARLPHRAGLRARFGPADTPH